MTGHRRRRKSAEELPLAPKPPPPPPTPAGPPALGRAHVLLRLPDGVVASASAGDLIGRLATAAVQVDDPRVSEGHAMISLRGGELWLLALRRRVGLAGTSHAELRLEPGQRVALAQGLEIEVIDVTLPTAAMAIEGPGLPPTAIPAVCALQVGPPVQLRARPDPEADCLLWDAGDGWRRSTGGVVLPLEVGDSWELRGQRFRALALPLGGSTPTRRTGGIDPPHRITARFDTAQVQVGDAPPVRLAGVQARILSELVAMGGTAPWEVVAREVWPDGEDTAVLRKRWDIQLSRLRGRLREAGARPELIRAVGTGQVELDLRPDDVVLDES